MLLALSAMPLSLRALYLFSSHEQLGVLLIIASHMLDDVALFAALSCSAARL